MTAHHECQQMRHFKVTHTTIHVLTGRSESAGEEWRTDKCKAPLFSDAEKQRGTCKSCHGGWTHPENYPVAEEKP